MKSCFVIAEIGVNHNCDFETAKKLIVAACECGADAVKFQSAIPELVVTTDAPMARYQQDNILGNDKRKYLQNTKSQLEMITEVMFPFDIFKTLKNFCNENGMVFFATAFDLISLQMLENLGQPCHKIPSGEITNLPYLRQIGGYKKPLIMSTGMATMEEIGIAIDVLERAGTSREDLTILHCNTAYPTSMKDVNLRAMCSIREKFSVEVGYSDHTIGFEVAIAAAALGAIVIEKHITLDKNSSGPDHAASMEPREFKEMVKAIRKIETALGSKFKGPSPSELENIPIVRRSLVAAIYIEKGEVFTAKNLIAKRPGTGLSAMKWDEVIGQLAKRDFEKDEFIEI